jgi:hypothetical protein
LALAYEAGCEAVSKRFKVKELDAAALAPSSKLSALADRLSDTPAKSREDLLEKVRVYELDPDILDRIDFGPSIARDVARLAASSLI